MEEDNYEEFQLKSEMYEGKRKNEYIGQLKK